MNGRGRGARAYGTRNNPTIGDQANERATLYATIDNPPVPKINMQSYRLKQHMEVRLSNYLLIAEVIIRFYLLDV